MNEFWKFKRSYWDYYLELEKQFMETKRFVEFDKINSKAYSLEYLKLYQAVCSEIDVVGKEIAMTVHPNAQIDEKATIKKWGYEVQQKFPSLKDELVEFNNLFTVQPFKNWEYEKHVSVDKHGNKRTGLRIKEGRKTLAWWINYNAIKHRRIGLLAGERNYQLANQSNLILALAALFLLEFLYMQNVLEYDEQLSEGSKLFKYIKK